ncbi:hypothetical protein SSX86_027529 [Deinandra increscens subsp. villosa]|uniref:Remorin C-terminal domain-containing protein n=1 Tax=Deinandra increscens subsp. villosa TaxID=3103831 RepID=A0AAP0CC52_9ASTR
MRSLAIEEDKSCLNKLHYRTTLAGKPAPSKWDDAQKWLVNLSRGVDKTNTGEPPRDSNADDRRLIVPNKLHPTSTELEIEEDEVIIQTKKVDPFGDSSISCVSRDMGTEMTPVASQEPSRSATPIRARSPGSSTPPPASTLTAPRLLVDATRWLEEEDIVVENPLETQALAWDEAERAKYMARFKREEAKIEAWENHEKRKAEMEMKRMEAKAERMKSRAQEKYMNKLGSTRRIAQEKRGKAEAVLNEKAVKTCERADYMRRTGHLPSSFSLKLLLLLPPPWCCR